MRSSSRATRAPPMDVSNTAARHSRLKSSMTFSTRNPGPSSTASDMKSSDHRWFGPCGIACAFWCPRRACVRPVCEALAVLRGRAGKASSNSSASLRASAECAGADSRTAWPSPNLSAMKSIDQVTLGASGTARTSGLFRFRRLRGLMRRFGASSQQIRWTRLWFHEWPLALRRCRTHRPNPEVAAEI